MQIVIDIPEKVVTAIQDGEDYRYDIHTAIAQGIPLPKGHGDLIDREYFMDKYAGCGNEYCENTSCKDCNSKIVNKFDIDSAPIIIPADSGKVD